jgi:hypothetical protein
MLEEVGVPESTLDVALHAGPAARRMLAEHLATRETIQEVARRNLEALRASGVLETIARMNVEVLRESGILEAIQIANVEAAAKLVNNLKAPSPDAMAAIQKLIANTEIGSDVHENRDHLPRQVEAPPAASSQPMPEKQDPE